MKVKEFLDLFKDMDPEDELKFDLFEEIMNTNEWCDCEVLNNEQ